MEFMMFKKSDFNAMHDWLVSLSADPRVKRARAICFDLMRYREAYEEIYTFIEIMGGKIEDD